MSDSIRVEQASSDDLMDRLYALRREVFVEEQGVSADDEFDEYEALARHFIALAGDICVGAARWRRTDKGIKLERFAVKASHRKRGVGSALMQRILEDIRQQVGPDQYLYLHAQLAAVPLYAKFDFEGFGDEFEECGIRHIAMQRLS